MKKLPLLAVLLLITTVLHAQSNSILVYGNLGINSSKVAQLKTSSFSFSPAVGYQWNDHWTSGISLSTSSIKSGSSQGKASSFGVGPFIRYAYTLSNIFAVYGQFNANYLSGNNYGTRVSGFESSLFPAIGVNLRNGFALNLNFGSLSLVTSKPDGNIDNNNNTSFGLNFGSGTSIGISKNFGL